MFRCKECQTEYEIKPDYCDCGNDTFDEILPEKTVAPEPKPKRIEIERPILTPKEKTKAPINTKIDAYAIIIFALCILMSFVVIFFVGNPQETIVEEIQQEINISKNIPSIDRFWDNTPVKAVEEKPAEQIQNIVEKIIPKVVVQPKPVQTKPAQKTVTPQKQTTQKPAQKQTTQTTQPQTTQKQSVQLPKSVTDITNKPTQTTAGNTQQTVKTQTVTPAPKKLDPTEYARYKNSLMTKIAQKINFAGVIGDGSCTVSFSMSSSGALINRKFEKQSENSTLNDAVYHAIMQTPTFNPPPEGYKNETIRLNVKMFNGTFEVTIN